MRWGSPSQSSRGRAVQGTARRSPTQRLAESTAWAIEVPAAVGKFADALYRDAAVRLYVAPRLVSVQVSANAIAILAAVAIASLASAIDDRPVQEPCTCDPLSACNQAQKGTGRTGPLTLEQLLRLLQMRRPRRQHRQQQRLLCGVRRRGGCRRK